MGTLAVVILTTGLLGAEDTSETDLGKLQGTWALVMAVRDGKDLADDEIAQTLLVIKGDTFAFPRDHKVGTGPSGTFKIDWAKSPRGIDATPASGPDAGKTWLGIYELDGDLYKVCFAPPDRGRPAQFVSRPGSGAIHSVWRRVKTGPGTGADSDEIQGTWVLESITSDGQKTEEAPFKGAMYVIAPGRYTATIGEQVLKVTYTLDALASPKAIDLAYHEETGETRMFKAIYKREGDTLMLCRDRSPEGARPKEFTAPAGSSRLLMVLTKKKP